MFRNPYADGLVVLLIVLLIFGPKRLPTLGRSLGQGLREFKDSITGESRDSEERPAIAQSTTPTAGDDAGQVNQGAPGDMAQGASGQTGQGTGAEVTPDRGSAEIGSSERRS